MIKEYAEKISALTNLPFRLVERIYELEKGVILDQVFLNKEQEGVVELPLHSYGNLIIKYESGEYKLGFKLSKEFEKEIKKVLKSKESALLKQADEVLLGKLKRNFKELV